MLENPLISTGIFSRAQVDSITAVQLMCETIIQYLRRQNVFSSQIVRIVSIDNRWIDVATEFLRNIK